MQCHSRSLLRQYCYNPLPENHHIGLLSTNSELLTLCLPLNSSFHTALTDSRHYERASRPFLERPIQFVTDNVQNHRKQLNFPRLNLNGALLGPCLSTTTPPPVSYIRQHLDQQFHQETIAVCWRNGWRMKGSEIRGTRRTQMEWQRGIGGRKQCENERRERKRTSVLPAPAFGPHQTHCCFVKDFLTCDCRSKKLEVNLRKEQS